MNTTAAGGPITTPTDDSAMGPDFDLEDFGILGTRKVGEGLTTPRTHALVGRKDMIFDDRRQMGMIAAFWSWFAALLSAWPPRRSAIMG
jgi:hypothetical protein